MSQIITKEILNLVDATPQTYVDIAPIIDSHTAGQELGIQMKIRRNITDVLKDLKRSGEIEYNDTLASSLTLAINSVFQRSSLSVRSTYKRVKELQNKQYTSSIKVDGNFSGNLNTGEIKGNQESFILPAQYPINQPTKEPAAPQINIIKRIWNWLMTNPMIIAIVGGLIAIIFGTIILVHFHIL